MNSQSGVWPIRRNKDKEKTVQQICLHSKIIKELENKSPLARILNNTHPGAAWLEKSNLQ